MPKSRNFFITKNNPTEALAEFFEVFKAKSKFCRVQLEKGESGTPHFQGVVGYAAPRHLASLRKQFPNCHIEPAKNAMAAWEYCGKEDGRLQAPLEFGIPPAAKNVKGDTAARNKMILEYGEVRAIEEGLVPIERFKSLAQSINLFRVMKKSATTHDQLESEWHYGVSGAGKSRRVRTEWPDAFIKSNNVWWDGYQAEDTVIIEEVGPKQIAAHHLKIWADHYPFKADVKGSQLHIRPKRIIVTSNYSIRDVYPDEQDYLPLERRFKVHHYTEPYQVRN